MNIAVDAMGGDNAPGAIVEGTAAALALYGDIAVTLFGREEALSPIAGGMERAVVVHAPDVIGNDEHPADALRQKPGASIVMAAEAVKDGRCGALLSAGSTGALLTAGIFKVGRLKGVSRPALAPLLPTLAGKPVMLLDAGANVDCKPEYLAQFAMMGARYMRVIEGVNNPKVALINIGAEAEKGNAQVKEAFPLLKALPLDFAGNIEPRDLLGGDVDVVVCDGFVGNVIVKQAEGLVADLFAVLKKAFAQNVRSKLGAALLYPALRGVKKTFDASEYGGWPLLGLAAPVYKAHGSSDARAVCAAIGRVRAAMLGGVVEQLSAEQ